MTLPRKQPGRPAPPSRTPMLAAVVGAGAGFLVGYLLPLALTSIEAIRSGVGQDNTGAVICCTAPLLTIAGGVGGFLFGKRLDQQKR